MSRDEGFHDMEGSFVFDKEMLEIGRICDFELSDKYTLDKFIIKGTRDEEVKKKFYDLITLTYEAELDAWIDVDFDGSDENG